MSFWETVWTNPWAHGGFYGAVVLTVVMVCVAYATYFERKFAGRMQSRIGPNMVGPLGLLQPIADAFKAMGKEDIVPRNADAFLFRLAPPLTLALALSVAAVIPFSPGLLASDLDIGVLYALAVSGLMSFPVWIAGWASNNKYALLGGMRMVAQSISYEIPMVLSALVAVVLSGSLSMAGIVEYQRLHGWFILWPPGLGAAAFVLFLTTALAEGNRIPFDIPEAESELVAGPTTEFTAIRWSIVAASEYAHSLMGSALSATLFLGGWDGPMLFGHAVPAFWMVFKTLGMFIVVTWIRWSLMRWRSDQLMAACWRYLVPFSLALVLIAGIWVNVRG